MKKNGERILDVIETIKNNGIIVKNNKHKNADVYVVSSKNYRAEVTINPPRWLGLTFDLLNEEGKVQLTYSIDTDLYDISRPKFQDFGKSIENEIVQFLESLAQGKILAGVKGGRPALIIPQGTGFTLVSKGRIFTTTKHFADFESVRKNVQDIRPLAIVAQ